MIIIDWGSFTLGFVLIGVVFIWWELHKRRTPNPYRFTLYRIKFPDYAIWSRQQDMTLPPLFQDGDLVRIKQGVHLAAGLVEVIEPNDDRQMIMPIQFLKRVSSYEASRYLHRFQVQQQRKAQPAPQAQEEDAAKAVENERSDHSDRASDSEPAPIACAAPEAADQWRSDHPTT